MGGLACNWRPRTRDLFRDIVILMRDTGMRNERELFPGKELRRRSAGMFLAETV
jgi:hypothetical protein